MAAAALCTFLNIFPFLFLVLASLVYSLSIDLQNFGPDYATKNINLYGDASFFNQAIQLTPFDGEQAHKAGRAMHRFTMHLWDKSSGVLADFSTTFSFNIDSDGSSSYGDGMAFFLGSFPNASDTSKTSGGGLGLMNEALQTSVDPFVAVVFDTYSSLERRPLTNVSINFGSTQVYKTSMEWHNDITLGKDNFALITYSSSSHILQVNFTGILGTSTWTHSLRYMVDLREYLPEYVWIGFSAATGSFFEKHTVKSWKFESTELPIPPPPPSPPPTSPPPPNSPPPNPTPSNSPEKEKKKLNIGELIGLCIVPVVGFAKGVFIYVMCKKRRSKQNVIILGEVSGKSSGAQVVKVTTEEPTTGNFSL